MSQQLPSSAQRVQDFPKEKGFDFKIRELAGSTRTAVDAVEGVGCSVSQIAEETTSP